MGFRVTARNLVFVLAASLTVAWAKGRQPEDDEKDPFPDYNKLELHHTAPAPQSSVAAAAPSADAGPARLPITRSSATAASGEDLSKPQPPPHVVPMRDESEPDLPTDSTAAPQGLRGK